MASSKRSRAPRAKSARPAAAPSPRANQAIAAAVAPPLAPVSLAHNPAYAAPSAESPAWVRDLLWPRAATPAPLRAETPAPQPPARATSPGLARAAAPATAPPARPAPQPSANAAPAPALSPEERRRMVAKLAYVRAEGIGFGRSNPVEDWLWAEQEVRRMLEARAA